MCGLIPNASLADLDPLSFGRYCNFCEFWYIILQVLMNNFQSTAANTRTNEIECIEFNSGSIQSFGHEQRVLFGHSEDQTRPDGCRGGCMAAAGMAGAHRLGRAPVIDGD